MVGLFGFALVCRSYVVVVLVSIVGNHGICRLSYKYDGRIATVHKGTCMICSSSGNIPTMNLLMYNIPRKIFTTRLPTTPNETQTCKSSRSMTRLIVLSIQIG